MYVNMFLNGKKMNVRWSKIEKFEREVVVELFSGEDELSMFMKSEVLVELGNELMRVNGKMREEWKILDDEDYKVYLWEDGGILIDDKKDGGTYGEVMSDGSKVVWYWVKRVEKFVLLTVLTNRGTLVSGVVNLEKGVVKSGQFRDSESGESVVLAMVGDSFEVLENSIRVNGRKYVFVDKDGEECEWK